MELISMKSIESIQNEDPSFQGSPSHFTPSDDALKIAKPPTKDVGVDWEGVLQLLKNNRHGHQYFTSIKDVEDGKTLLHYACIQKNKQAATERVQTILAFCAQQHMEVEERIAFVNKKDKKGNTALQLATKKRNKVLVKLLIENGADINLLKKKKVTDATRTIYDKVLITMFDQSIHLEKDGEDELANESDWKVDCDFGPITGHYDSNSSYQNNPRNQTRQLACLLRREIATRAVILQHPLVQIFLRIKEDKFVIFLAISLMHHIFWSLLSFAFIFCNTHILDSASNNNSVSDINLTALCQPFRIYDISKEGLYDFRYNVYFYIMIVLHLYSVALEFVKMKKFPYYWKRYENWGQQIVNLTLLTVWIVSIIIKQLSIIFSPFLFAISEREKYDIDRSGEDENQSDVTTEVIIWIWEVCLPTIYFAGMIASLLLIQSHLSKTEVLGIYNEMFAKGFQNIMKFLLAFLPLLLAFMIIFHILMPMKKEFSPAWGLGFTNLLYMMTGEVDYGDVFYGDDKGNIAFKSVLKLLHLIFVITMVLLLHNLLIGMTVSDVQKLEKQARVNNLARRLDVINMTENLIVHPLVVKFMMRFKLDNLFKRAFIVEKIDTQKVKLGIPKRNKRLDEYSFAIRKAIIKWDKNRQIEG